MREASVGGVSYFEFESYPANGYLQHAVFTRLGGISPAPFASLNLSLAVSDTRANVTANRQRAYGLFDRDTGSVVHAHLVHGNDVARVTRQNQGQWMVRVDGLLTDEPGCALTMNYADCAPIFLYDPHKQAIALGHAGWQGAVRDLPGALVRAMQMEFGSDPASMLAGIGPSIGPCCYEVDEPVISAVRNAFRRPEWLLRAPDGLAWQTGRPHFDLPAANRLNLQRAGVQQVEQAGYCTACRTDLFFSHRAEKGKTGRFGAFFMLT